MAVIHISEAEASRDFKSVMVRVRAGEEFVIEEAHAQAVATLQPMMKANIRRLSESLKIAKAQGSTATIDGNFAEDLAVAVNSRTEPLSSTWE